MFPELKTIRKIGPSFRPARSRGKPFLRFACLAALSLFSLANLIGQQQQEFMRIFIPPPPPDPLMGLHYFAVENLDTNTVVQRGFAGSAGVAFDRLILAPDTNYRIWFLRAEGLLTGFVEVLTPPPGRRLPLPDILLGTDISADPDGDGLGNDAEFILGTLTDDPDSDDDGILDRAEAEQGTDPLEGTIVRTGIIGSVNTPGVAVDIDAFNDMVVVADTAAGVIIFNVFNAMEPRIMAQVNTPGVARDVAIAGDLIAVADGFDGLTIIDLSQPPTATILNQINLGAPTRAVASDGIVGFAGLDTGAVAAVELSSGVVVDQLAVAALPIQDLTVASDFLYVLVEGKLYILSFNAGQLAVEGSVATPGLINTATGRMRLAVGGNIAYAARRQAYNTIDVSNPQAPVLIASGNTAQFGWKQIAVNGSGLGVAAVGRNSTSDGPHNISLYDVSDPNNNDNFIIEFPTPGLARSVAIFNGLAYVADSQAGLQVINYVAFDTLGVPPTVTALETNLAGGIAEEGKPVRVTAEVDDDVQVRNVEFFLDGEKFATDGNFPFEVRFNAPLLADQPTFTLQTRVSDTGGNSTFSNLDTFQILPDATPPQVVSVLPNDGAVLQALAAVSVTFNEPMAANTINASSFLIVSAGPDGVLGNGDDATLPAGAIAYVESFNSAVQEFSSTPAPGLYAIRVSQEAADLAGNGLLADFESTFRIAGLDDADGDGVPDDIEPLLGLDPALLDTNNNTINDGDEDFDNDGLSNAGEIIVGSDPTNPDSNGNGIDDGAEDSDLDGLSDSQEIANGTAFDDVDTDDDGYDDNGEILAGTNPNDNASTPLTESFSLPVTYFNGGNLDSFSVTSPPASFTNTPDLENAPTHSAVSQPVSFDNPP